MKLFTYKTTKNLIFKKKKLVAGITYCETIAKKFHDTKYYESMESEIKKLPNKKHEKWRLKTPRRASITKFIQKYKLLLDKKSEKIFNALQGIYNTNLKAAINNTNPPIHSNLLYLTTSVPMLVVAYKKVRKNKGATTLGYYLSDNKYNKLNPQQKTFLNKTFKLPDGMSKKIFVETSKLLRKGLYPWGASRRIYVDKPGKPGALRPITIPPFMDRVIQAAITIVLNAVYEPWFEKMNCSFGFRPRKGVHNAIFRLTQPYTQTMNTAIEGDIKSAYDKVSRKILIKNLNKRIHDKKFLQLLEQRLEYQYWDSTKLEYIEDNEGIPQGGIDSPYLWNIYMMEFDKFVQTHTNETLEKLNQQAGVSLSNNTKIIHPEKRKINRTRSTISWMISICNKYINHENKYEKINQILSNKDPKNPPPADGLQRKAILKELKWEEVYKNKKDINKEFKYKLIQEKNKLNHKSLRLPNIAPGKLKLKFIYTRYADDFIVITNAPKNIVQQLKDKYTEFLKNELEATLSEEKTLITDFRINPAHFLGFEVRTYSHNKIAWVQRADSSTYKAAIAGKRVFTLPDRQRLIDRLHMKGYCDKNGEPKEVGWLSYLEPYIIIERYNSVIRGFANYYTEFVETPQKSLGRWIYILRYSCLKTLAQKYNTSIKKIFKQFPYKNTNKKDLKLDKSKTISCSVRHIIDGNEYEKTWTLLTLKDALQKAREIQRLDAVATDHYNIENGQYPQYEQKEGSFPTLSEENFLETIKWVNLRTQASLDAPCCICGSTQNVQMHHIKHIRKQRYELIPKEITYKRQMALRNRKQIPTCKECHMNLIHKGKYGGTKLNYIAPKVMYDGRLFTLEAHIHKGQEKDYTKTLEQKGWRNTNKEITDDNLQSKNEQNKNYEPT